MGEIAGAVIATAVFAAAVPLLVHGYYERAEMAGSTLREEIDREVLRAGEQVAVGGAACSGGVLKALLHNYGAAALDSSDMLWYKTDAAGGIARHAANVTDLAGKPGPLAESGDTVLVRSRIDCPSEGLLLITGAGNRVVVVP